MFCARKNIFMNLRKFVSYCLISLILLALKISCKEFIFQHNDNICKKQYIKNYYLHSDSLYGAEKNPTSEPIGGNVGYSKIISKYKKLVKTREELLEALKTAKKGDIIFVSDTSKIDLTNFDNIEIPE